MALVGGPYRLASFDVTAYGRFDDASREYVITRPDTPLPWLNYLGQDDFFGLCTNTGGGYTFFRDAMRAVQGLRPEALVLPIPRDDVQAIASQAAFYALDTLGVQLMGTAAWGDAAVRGSVSNRYTEGVVMATPRVELDGEVTLGHRDPVQRLRATHLAASRLINE